MDLFQSFFVAYRQQGPCPVDPVSQLFNMDTRDAQDIQDETLLHTKLTRCVSLTRTQGAFPLSGSTTLVFLRVSSWITLFLLFQTSLFVRSGSQKKAPARTEPGPIMQLAFHQNSNARLKRADRIPARNPGSRVAVGELMLKVGWLGEYPQLA